MIRKKLLSGFGIAASVLLLSSAYAGTISGTIHYEGKAPKAKKLKMNADPFCKGAHKKAPHNDEIVVNDGNVEGVFVYIKSGLSATQKTSAKPMKAEIDQHGCLYEPKVVGVVAGQPLIIKNSDSTLHNVHSFAKSNQNFNQAMSGVGSIEKTFAKPEMGIKMKCDVHPWMSSYINVMDHPFFATTNEKGEFTIKDIPDGEYTLEAWHVKLGTKTASVKVSGSAKVDLKMSK